MGGCLAFAMHPECGRPGSRVHDGDLLDIEVGSIINTHHASGNPVPIWVNEVRIGWAEFDVIGKHVAVRITEVC